MLRDGLGGHRRVEEGASEASEEGRRSHHLLDGLGVGD